MRDDRNIARGSTRHPTKRYSPFFCMKEIELRSRVPYLEFRVESRVWVWRGYLGYG